MSLSRKIFSLNIIFYLMLSLAVIILFNSSFIKSHLKEKEYQQKPQDTTKGDSNILKSFNSNLKYLFGKNNSTTITNKTNLEDLDIILEIIFKKIIKKQSKSDVTFREFPPRSSEIKGLFSSYIHLNFIDNENSFLGKISRNNLAALDMNMFVSNFVICSLLESFEFSLGMQQKDEKLLIMRKSISEALEALLLFRDKNYADKIPIYNFWKQENVNGTWAQAPDTMLNLVKNAPHFSPWFLSLLRKIGLSNLADFLETFQIMTGFFLYAFRIPPDADDTSVNMALTGLLYKHQLFNQKDKNIINYHFNKFSDGNVSESLRNEFFKNKNKDKLNVHKKFHASIKNWFRNNSDFAELFNLLKFKAYRPFISYNFTKNYNTSNGQYTNNTDLIDPRTYFVIRKFLEQKFKNKEDVVLPTTWIFDLESEQKYHPIITMPFIVNNVDFNVITNFLYGVTNLVLNHPDVTYITNIFDEEIQKMYSDTIDLIVHAIENDIMGWRPDLALLYYPSIFDFYWLISRVYSTLKNSQLIIIEKFAFENLKHNYTEAIDVNKAQKIFGLFNMSKSKLEAILKNELTNIMIKKLQDQMFYVEFLGNTDKLKRNEDSLFTTALGLNSFLNIWTKEVKSDNNSKKLIYDEEVSEDIKVIVHALAEFLMKHNNEYFPSLEGAFFSGSVKSATSNAVFFPGNFYKYLNGTDLSDHSQPISIASLTCGMKGFVSEEEYEILLKQDYFGQKTPVDFVPFSSSIFPYWSSPAMTLSINYLALTKYSSLIE